MGQFKTALSNTFAGTGIHKRSASGSKQLESPSIKRRDTEFGKPKAVELKSFLTAPRMPTSWRARSKTTIVKQKLVAQTQPESTQNS